MGWGVATLAKDAATRGQARSRAQEGNAVSGDPAASVAAFARLIFRVELWPHQVALSEADAFIRVVAAARRTGKSEYAELEAMWTAFSHAGCIVLILSATQEAARRLTESIGQRLAGNRLTRGAVVDDFATRVRLSNGSQIISLPASQRQIRGYGKNVRLVVLDEAGFMPQEIWAAASYTALDERRRGSRILLLGTPWGGADHFFRRAFMAGQEGDPDHFSYNWTHKANPLLDHAYLERQRERVSPAEYAAEVLGEWSEAAGSLFSRELLDRQTADLVVPELQELSGPARGIVGCDWGASFDRSAAVGIYRLPIAHLNPDQQAKPRFVLLPWVWPIKTPLGETVRAVSASAARFKYVASETNGIGAMPTQELFGSARRAHPRTRFTWVPVNTSAASKTAGYGVLLSLLEDEALVLPRDPTLLRQLAGLRFEQGARGFMHIGAEDDAVHDDVADAAMLATLPHRPPRAKRVLCHLAHLGRARNAPHDLSVPEVACPVVASGGGLRLPQRPSLQSVAGTAVSHYADLMPARATGIRVGDLLIKTTHKGVVQ